MNPQPPFKCRYILTQNYYQNLSGYAEGHHGGLDLWPLDDQNKQFPAEIYAILPGKAIVISDSNTVRGKGIKVRTKLDQPFIDYLIKNNVLPSNINGYVYLDTLYWHCLEVLDKDGDVSQETPIAKAGNTGNVWSQGVPVPDDQKGKPPYPGLHLHLECVLYADTKLLNLDKDPYGRIDPFIILNFRPMPQTYHIKIGDKIGVLVVEGFTFGGGFAKDMDALKKLDEAFEVPADVQTIELPQ